MYSIFLLKFYEVFVMIIRMKAYDENELGPGGRMSYRVRLDRLNTQLSYVVALPYRTSRHLPLRRVMD